MSEVMSNKSTTYKLRRYFTPSSITAAQTLKARGAGARKRLMRVTFNYTHLIESHNRKVQFEGLNPQTAANRATALRKFLEANFIAANDVVGREMRSDYSIAIERFTHKLVQEGRSSRAISNTKSALRIWREMVIEHDTIEAQHGNIATPFIESLRQLVNEKSIALVARQSGVPLDMLRGWLVNGREGLVQSLLFDLNGFLVLSQIAFFRSLAQSCQELASKESEVTQSQLSFVTL